MCPGPIPSQRSIPCAKVVAGALIKPSARGGQMSLMLESIQSCTRVTKMQPMVVATICTENIIRGGTFL